MLIVRSAFQDISWIRHFFLRPCEESAQARGRGRLLRLGDEELSRWN
jgi:hypothetical protein